MTGSNRQDLAGAAGARFRYRKVGERRLQAVCQACGEFCKTRSWSEERSTPGKGGKGAAWSTIRHVNLCIACEASARRTSEAGLRLVSLGDLP